ncbi:hypothetical protein [uncultured Maribacter sp.]|uniref:hypothetical protein n=1 Tax=uncultured Maribacter sp. TaxID=431308 RepID=UPI00260FE858|nr:hypothetical protein [uncultured Maribacter sp.]
MNKSFKINIKQVIAAIILFTNVSFAQNQSKKIQESFMVKDSAVLEINTSYADIEFKTWDKNEVLIQATVFLEGATDQEAKEFLNDDVISILGNSKKISITTDCEDNLFFNTSDFVFNELHVELPEIPEIPEMPEIEQFVEIVEAPELPKMPPLPPMAKFNFDYKAYKKEGDVYLKKWQKEFEKSFNKDYQKKIVAWSERMEEKQEEMAVKREKLLAKRNEKREIAQRKRQEAQEERVIVLEKRREAQRQARRSAIIGRNSNTGRNTFYYTNNGASKKFKIKKAIKITVPKSIKIKMNVRHGEVKLAENTRNLKATLSHSNLFGDTIDGNETMIIASYSPVSVQKWNYGNLKANYSEFVTIDEVLYLNLNSTSTDVIIDKVYKTVIVNNKFGPLQINYIDDGFEKIDVSMQNAEFICELPDKSCLLYVEGKASNVDCPESLGLVKEDKGNIITCRNESKVDLNKKVTIKAKYSDIVLK